MDLRTQFILIRGTVLLQLFVLTASADDRLVLQGFDASRYEILWTKSPFAVESPQGSASQASSYTLVGVARLDGVDYASLVNKQTNERYMISSQKPEHGISLISINRPGPGQGTSVQISVGGQQFALKLETGPTLPQPILNPPPQGNDQAGMPGQLVPTQPARPGVLFTPIPPPSQRHLPRINIPSHP